MRRLIVARKTASVRNPTYHPKAELGSARVTVSIDPKLLKVVDRYAKGTRLSRSAVFEEALLLWYEKLQEEADRQFYSKEADDPAVRNWSKVTSKTVSYLWNE